MAKFKKKPIVIEAIQWDGTNETRELIETSFNVKLSISENWLDKTNDIVINTLEGKMTGIVGDWIIKGVKDEIYPCKNDVFQESYEKVE